ncbi:hypothetical protein B0H14DRAFT_3874973 [Mycena olivaceomarginata]|nr:hypothetical protein B0H14DRAFT_3874973 [Mycena olivaceomarginata]
MSSSSTVHGDASPAHDSRRTRRPYKTTTISHATPPRIPIATQSCIDIILSFLIFYSALLPPFPPRASARLALVVVAAACDPHAVTRPSMTCAAVSHIGARALWGRWSGTRSAGEARAFLMVRGYDVGRIRSWARWLLSAAGDECVGVLDITSSGCLRSGVDILRSSTLTTTHTNLCAALPTSDDDRVTPPRARLLSLFLDAPAVLFEVHWMMLGRGQGRRHVVWTRCSRGASRTLADAEMFAALHSPAALGACAIALESVFGAQLVARARCVIVSVPSPSSHSHGKAHAHMKPETRMRSDRPTLLLLGIQLGLDSVNPMYHETVKMLYTFSQPPAFLN